MWVLPAAHAGKEAKELLPGQEVVPDVKTATGARGLPTSLHSRDEKQKKTVNAKLFWRSWEMCASRRKTGSHSVAKDREMLEETVLSPQLEEMSLNGRYLLFKWNGLQCGSWC